MDVRRRFLLLLLHLLSVLMLVFCLGHNGQVKGPPSPGYYPSSRIGSVGFNQLFRNLWGPQHQIVDQDGLTIWLDTTSGSGFKSMDSYSSGYFGAAIKLQTGYTAGIITSFYLSNNEEHPGNHDEIDIEFLGTTPDKPYTLQTNVYVRGSGDGGAVIGREMKFQLWFDPTQNFHNYAIIWNPNEIIFLVDDVPIRRYPGGATFPNRRMWVYGSIWDASSWATENGRYKADYRYEPFVARYTSFKVGSSSARGLTKDQDVAMGWVHNNYMIYHYCTDPARDHNLTPECIFSHALSD